MDAVTITHNGNNSWTGFGVLVALGLLIVSEVGMIVSWPFRLSILTSR